jgi:hypothetical protein
MLRKRSQHVRDPDYLFCSCIRSLKRNMHCRITLLIWLLMPWRRSSAELIRFTEGLADDSVLSRVVRSVTHIAAIPAEYSDY